MLKNWKRILALLCISAMLLTTLTACGADETVEDTASVAVSASQSEAEPVEEAPEAPAEPEPEAAVEEAPSAVEPDELKQELTPEQDELLALIPEGDQLTFLDLPLAEEGETLSLFLGVHTALLTMYDSLAEVPFYKALEEQTGVKIDFVAISSMAMDDSTLSLMIAADDLTDMGSFGSGLTQGIDNAISDGTIIDLKDYFDVMPNYSALIEGSEVFRKAVTTTGGHIAGAQQYTLHNAAIYRTGLMARGDWLEDLGLETPQTISEFHDMLVRFKNEKGAAAPYDLDNAGGIFSGATGMGASGTYLTRAYGTDGGDFRLDENGTVQSGWMLDGFKEYLIEMNKWYEEGLMASDFYTAQKQMSDWSKVTGGVNGVIATHASEMQEIKAQCDDPNFELVAIPDPVLNEGDMLELEHWFMEATPAGGYNVSANCKNPELACKWLDYLFSPNGWLLCNFGIEGESFEYGEDGMPHWTEVITNPVDIPTGVAKSLYMIVQGPCLMYSPREFDAYTDAMIEASDIWAGNTAEKTYEYPNTITLVGEDAEEYNSLLSDVGTYISETAVRFIIGEKNFDGDYDAFISTIESMDIARMLEIKQAAYNDYLAA